MQNQIRISAPGSVMLMGEHAVVKGYWAIACAVDKKIAVTLSPRSDNLVQIDSAICQYVSPLVDLKKEQKLSFVLQAVEQFSANLTTGFDLKIEAQFSHTLGLGSSAAVTVATVKALAQYTNLPLTKEQHLQKSLAVVHAVQGRGSGTDIAASIYGGIIAYQVEPCQVIPLQGVPNLSLFYAGYKTRTPDVLAIVAKKESLHPEIYAQLYKMMNQITLSAVESIKDQQWAKLGELMNIYQGQMDSLGVNDAALSDMIYQLRSQKNKLLGAKISGSGLGDCVISLGECEPIRGYQQIKFNVCVDGVVCYEC
jgi:mevalonate kinase